MVSVFFHCLIHYRTYYIWQGFKRHFGAILTSLTDVKLAPLYL